LQEKSSNAVAGSGAVNEKADCGETDHIGERHCEIVHCSSSVRKAIVASARIATHCRMATVILLNHADCLHLAQAGHCGEQFIKAGLSNHVPISKPDSLPKQ
jgi:hypothetical protein